MVVQWVFRLLQSGETEAVTLGRYGQLLDDAASPTDRSFRQIVQADSGKTTQESVQEQLLAVACELPDMSVLDVQRLVIALTIDITAFPDEGPLPEVPLE